MKVLSLYPEHAEAFRRGLRTIETRSWSTTYRGPLAIYATKRKTLREASWENPQGRASHFALRGIGVDSWHHGAITVVLDLVDCLPIFEDPDDVPDEGPFIHRDPIDERLLEVSREDAAGSYFLQEGRMGYFEQGNYGLVLANPRPIEPVKLPRSQVPQGRPWDLRGEALDQVLAQMEVAA